ncbi:MAG: nucleoside triphosphate pyrophosphohydrolase [Syntrophomonadaceae bacterium]|nr:nucleoside triphosphate pyrophosphohydrolase [Syntrophomonadaceae bacterium]
MEDQGIKALMETMNKLLSPEGCPWDREQTHTSLRRYLVEETYEVLAAIDDGDMNELREELGDLLLQIVFHSALAEREGAFNLSDVANIVNEKMINRHPHVFGHLEINSSDEVMQHWEGFKRDEGKKSILEGIPRHLPALLRAYKLQEKAARVGFDWPQVQGALKKLNEETAEFIAASQDGSPEMIEEEMGDILFTIVNIARMSGIEPEQALQNSNAKFTRRFNHIESRLNDEGQLLEEAGLEKLDKLWDEAKANE